MQKRWKIKDKSDQNSIETFSAKLNQLDETLTNILLQREINTFDKAKSFFRPSLSETHDPFLMKDMDKAVERLQFAIENEEKILIYGDYDVDGTTAVSLVYSYLKNYYNNIEYYIPDRYTEGYGISYQGIDYAVKNKFKLIIALDCGIKAIEKIDYAKDKKVDFIICDHHRPSQHIPKAVAVLDQKRKDCEYPYKELSGCGVGFKLMEAWSIKTKKEKDFLYGYLDLLAISICADIVPITGENRVFVYHGLKIINSNPSLGIKMMLELADFKREVTVTDLLFTIAPQINAAGRIKSGNRAVEMLVAEKQNEALIFGKKINELNIERKGLDKSITQEALDIISDDELLQKKKTTVLYNSKWHKGVIGIVASRLIETYYRPTIILTESNGKATGSARSVMGFDVYNAIEACSYLLEQFGGHKYAAGLTLPLANLEDFIKKFEEVVDYQIEKTLLVPQILIDTELNFNQINNKFYNILRQFSPTGPGNMRPVFLSENVFSTKYSKIVGDNHLKLQIFQEDYPDLKINGIAFNLGYLWDELAEGVPFRIVYSIEENYWNGNTSLQLNIKDIKF